MYHDANFGTWAYLWSPPLVNTGLCDVTFYYLMYGDDVNSLSLLIGLLDADVTHSFTSTIISSALWSRDGQQSHNATDWRQAEVTVNTTVTGSGEVHVS